MFDITNIRPDNIFDVAITDPGVGITTVTYVIPEKQNQVFIPINIAFDIVSSAVAGTRHGSVYIARTGQNIYWSILDELGFTGTLYTCNYYLSFLHSLGTQNGGFSATGGTRNAGLPLILMLPGERLTLGMNTLIDAGDKIQQIRIRFLRSTGKLF